jgi:hypothetical protein
MMDEQSAIALRPVDPMFLRKFFWSTMVGSNGVFDRHTARATRST